MMQFVPHVIFVLAVISHVGAMLLGRHLILRHVGVPFRTLKIDEAVWRRLDWRRRIGSFWVPVLFDVLALSAILFATGFVVPATTSESFVEPVPDGAAAAAGLVVGDRVVRVEGRPVATFIEMRAAIVEAAAKNDVLTVEVDRAGASRTFEVKHRSGLLGVRPVMRSATFSDAVSYAVGVPTEHIRLVGALLSSSPNVRVGGPRAIVAVLEEVPRPSLAATLMHLLSICAVYTFWLVPLLCMIGTPWGALWTRRSERSAGQNGS